MNEKIAELFCGHNQPHRRHIFLPSQLPSPRPSNKHTSAVVRERTTLSSLTHSSPNQYTRPRHVHQRNMHAATKASQKFTPLMILIGSTPGIALVSLSHELLLDRLFYSQQPATDCPHAKRKRRDALEGSAPRTAAAVRRVGHERANMSVYPLAAASLRPPGIVSKIANTRHINTSLNKLCAKSNDYLLCCAPTAREANARTPFYGMTS